LRFALNYTKWKATTTRKVTQEEFNDAAKKMKKLEDVIPQYHPSLVLEMDETGIPWCPAQNYTYAPKGQKKIVIPGQCDKRSSSGTIIVTQSGQFLPLQVIWEGKSNRSIPKSNYPNTIINCFAGPSEPRTEANKKKKNSNKWQNKKTIKEYIDKIIHPYLSQIRNKLSTELELCQKKQLPCLFLINTSRIFMLKQVNIWMILIVKFF
jgi:hypothetical protein